MIERLDFSTSNLPPAQREKSWWEYMAETFFRLDFDSKGAEHGYGILNTVAFPGLSLTRYSLANQELMTRRRQAVAHDSENAFLFVFPFRGRYEFSQSKHGGLVSDAGMFCLNSADGYRIFVSEQPESLTVKLPISTVRDRIKWIEDCAARSDIADPALIPLVRQFCLDLAKVEAPEKAAQLQNVLLDLLTLTIEGRANSFRGERIPISMKDTLAAMVEAYVARRFAKHDLSISDAAKDLGVSVRSIQKVLYDRETTFGKMLLSHRLDEADRLLSKPGKAQQLRLGQIAYLCGFVNQAHFATRFRLRFDLSPRGRRQRACDTR